MVLIKFILMADEVRKCYFWGVVNVFDFFSKTPNALAYFMVYYLLVYIIWISTYCDITKTFLSEHLIYWSKCVEIFYNTVMSPFGLAFYNLLLIFSSKLQRSIFILFEIWKWKEILGKLLQKSTQLLYLLTKSLDSPPCHHIHFNGMKLCRNTTKKIFFYIELGENQPSNKSCNHPLTY